MDKVIGMSESQYYCNACQQTHYGDAKCPLYKPIIRTDCWRCHNLGIVESPNCEIFQCTQCDILDTKKVSKQLKEKINKLLECK